MQNIVDPRQTSFYDPFDHLWSPLARKTIVEGWQGVFRHVILEVLPVDVLAGAFDENLGRPTKELYSMAGLIFIMEFNDWTVEQAANAYMFDMGVHYALNLEPALQSMSTRTVERYRAIFRENDIAAGVMEDVTLALITALDKSIEKQRLDSTHVFSNMALFGRTQLMGVVIKRFLTQLRRHDLPAYEALPEALRMRYTPSVGHLFGDTARDAESRCLLRQQVAEDMYELIGQFEQDDRHTNRTSYKALVRVFEEQCELVEDKVGVKKKTGGRVLQNPSDPDATYDGKKGPGYQVQLCETCHEDDDVQLVTSAIPQTAADSDANSVEDVREDLKKNDRLPKQMLGDGAYGSDENVQDCKQDSIDLVSPVNRSKRAPDKLHVEDFEIDPETECVVRCPVGHAPVESTHDAATGKTHTYMDGITCAECPEQERCPVKGKGARRSFYHTPGERRRGERIEHEKTPEFRETYAKRAGVEGTIGRIKRCTGLGRLRVRGQPAVFMAILLKVAGWNVLQAAKAQRMREKVAQSINQAGKQLEIGLLNRRTKPIVVHIIKWFAQIRENGSFLGSAKNTRPFGKRLLSVPSLKGD